MLSVVRGTTDKPVATDALVASLAEIDVAGELFIGYPLLAGIERRPALDGLLLSTEHGLVIFDLVEGADVGDYLERQDEAALNLQARLLTHRGLVKRRDLLVEIHTLTFAPAASAASPLDGCISDTPSLDAALAELTWPASTRPLYDRTLSAIQSISALRRNRAARRPTKDDSRGARLARVEDSIETLDHLQSKAVIETVDRVQRIRGLAGSGKTIVLALKAAYLHAQHPDWTIAVTFNTRSLKSHFRRLITNFCIEQTSEEPDWDNLRVINAWGAPGGVDRDGIYFQFCAANELEYYNLTNARSRFGRGNEFAGACATALESVSKPKALYDAVLVDEAQDLPAEFLRLCYAMLGNEKRLVYAYDELQNLIGSGLPPAEEIFGSKQDGSPEVTFENPAGPLAANPDIILEKCYRNPRPVLVTAHALGFGIYRKPPGPKRTGLVQMFDDSSLWHDIGYRRMAGDFTGGEQVVLKRTSETSPEFLEQHSPLDDLIQFRTFSTEGEQAEWVAGAVARNLRRDELRHDDIIVINADPATARQQLGPTRALLLGKGIKSHVAGVDTDPDVFGVQDSVTFTGIHRAKGNEAAMVYVLNAGEGQLSAANLARLRNRLFTAITRSKAWVRVTGIGREMEVLEEEFGALRGNKFELRFRYPTDEERTQLEIVHRDMSPDAARHIERRRSLLDEVVSDLEQGRLFPEDFDEEQVTRLQDLLRRHEP